MNPRVWSLFDSADVDWIQREYEKSKRILRTHDRKAHETDAGKEKYVDEVSLQIEAGRYKGSRKVMLTRGSKVAKITIVKSRRPQRPLRALISSCCYFRRTGMYLHKVILDDSIFHSVDEIKIKGLPPIFGIRFVNELKSIGIMSRSKSWLVGRDYAGQGKYYIVKKSPIVHSLLQRVELLLLSSLNEISTCTWDVTQA